MRLNDKGDILAGAGGVQGSYNQVPYPFQTYGGGSPLDANTALVSIPAPSPNLANLATWHPGDAAPAVIAIGPNDFTADGGKWVAWRSGYGFYGSLGLIPEAGTAGLHAIAPDGTVAYIPNRAVGYGLRLVDPNGTTHDIPGIVPSSVQALGAGKVIWAGGAYGRSVPKPAVADAQNLLLATLNDGDWLVYWSNSVGFVVQPDGATTGYILGTTPTFYNHDIRVVNGELKIAWSTTQGEGPADVRSTVINRNAPRVPLVPAQPPFTVAPVGHPLTVSAFKDPSHATNTPCMDCGDLGVYTSDPNTILPDNRMMFCQDDGNTPQIPVKLKSWDTFLLECYPIQGETTAQSKARWLQNAESLLSKWQGDCGIVAAFYCQGGAPPNELWPVSHILELLGDPLHSVVSLSSRFKVLAAFAYDRANGMTAHPELLDAYHKWVAASPGQATFTPKPAPIPPDPTPIPPQPQEPKMLALDSTPIAAITGDPIDNGNGTISIRKANGKIVCLTPQGTWEERDSPGGPWESFVRCSNGLYANRDWDGKLASYIIAFVETK